MKGDSDDDILSMNVVRLRFCKIVRTELTINFAEFRWRSGTEPNSKSFTFGGTGGGGGEKKERGI